MIGDIISLTSILVIIDMQNDFITGSLGTENAISVLPKVINKAKSYDYGNIYVTMDTHNSDYLNTLEGKKLPILHCIKGTDGWNIPTELYNYVHNSNIIEKSSFASFNLAEKLFLRSQVESIEIELTGVCTDICVISNALLLRSKMPNVKISVDPSCCAGTSVNAHNYAIEIMKMCQIDIL